MLWIMCRTVSISPKKLRLLAVMARASDASQHSASRNSARDRGGGDSPFPAVVQHSVAGELLLPASMHSAPPRTAGAAAPSPAGSDAGGAGGLKRTSSALRRASMLTGKAARRNKRFIDSDTESDILQACLSDSMCPQT